MKTVSFHKPSLWPAGARLTAGEKLAALRRALGRRLSADRVAVALYDAKTGTARTFLSSGDRPTPLAQYEAELRHARSLRVVQRSQQIRLVGDMTVFAGGKNRHTRALSAAGFRSSAAFPFREAGGLAGFVFINSRRRNAFRPRDLPILELFVQAVIAAALGGPRSAVVLRAALKTARGLMRRRDPETGDHLERMARYCRVIAQGLARDGRARFDDERVQYIESFAPLHDVGKMAVPDRVLLKRGALTPAEKRIMRGHALGGRRIVDDILKNFGLRSMPRAGVLREIAHHHHEAMDGTGYPDRLRGRRIPIEARIVAVADVFDALTSARAYKDAWAVDRALAWMKKLSAGKLDRDCVEALVKNRSAIEKIRRRFREQGRLPLVADRDIPVRL